METLVCKKIYGQENFFLFQIWTRVVMNIYATQGLQASPGNQYQINMIKNTLENASKNKFCLLFMDCYGK